MKKINLFNSLTKKKEEFKPLDPLNIKMYCCGPTVYNYAHIGNARAAITADVLYKILSFIYNGHVKYVRNITDIDDKIIDKAEELSKSEKYISEKYTKIYQENMIALGCSVPSLEPKATDYVDMSISMIEMLIGKGFAYENDGHVFFDVSSFDKHGQLVKDSSNNISRISQEESSIKRSSADFVLWKPTSKGLKWSSPFGYGRMGWHIECSTMIKHTLGDTIDIHCGGIDLKFPHHENEIAQSECANNKKLSNFWIHNEFVNIDDNKMSKSLGNVKLIDDILENYSGDVVRHALIKTHYRKELNWTDDVLVNSLEVMNKYYRMLSKYQDSYSAKDTPIDDKLLDFLLNDMNVPEFLNSIDEMFNYTMKNNCKATAYKIIKHMNLIGLLKKHSFDYFLRRTPLDVDDILPLLFDIETARENKDFDLSDSIREDLKKNNIYLEYHNDKIYWYTE